MRRLTFICVVLLSFGVVVAAQAPLDPSQFAANLRTLADRISRASPADAADINKTIPAVWTVEHQSRRYEVPGVWLRGALLEAGDEARWPAHRAAVAGRLTALARDADALAQVKTPADARDSRLTLERILADRQFAGLQRQSAVQRVWQAALDWVAGVLRRLGLGRVAGAATAEAIAWTISILALTGLTVWLITALKGSSRRRSPSHLAPAPERLTASTWARRAAAADDIREAVRCGYRAATCRLEEEGVWRIDDARTPREYIRLLPPDHRRRVALTDVVRRFEEIWYGARGVTDDDRRTVLGRLREMECLPAD